MKTTTVLAILLACAAGCSKNKPPAPAAPGAAPQPGAAAAPRAAPDITADQQVSQSLAVSPEIASACGIVAPASPSPTFDYDREDLSPEDRDVLGKIATCFITGPLKGKSAALIGRADPRGTDEYNLGLGSRRAQSVSQYLVRLGVPTGQLTVTTRGELDATGTNEATWAKDRRVDVQLASN